MTTAVIKDYAQVGNAEEKSGSLYQFPGGVVICSVCTFVAYYLIALFAKEYVALSVDYFLLIVAVLFFRARC
jgi:hypothetical protein